jgi:molybdopterin converting factor small subunit
LRREIARIEPRLAKSLATARFAVNCDFVSDESMIGGRDEVAIIGSVCGG